LLNLVVNGNAYCVITRSGERIVSLLPIMSAQVEPMMLDDGSMVYNYTNDSGIAVFAAENIWHLKLMGNGTIGMSPLAYQRNSLGIAQAAESAVTKIYRNGAKPSGVLSIDRLLKPEQREQVRSNFATMTTSADDRLMVLEAGMKFEKVSLSPQDIELLSSRKFQISEVCRWYGVPSVMVNDNNGTSVWGSGIEQVMQGFYKLTLRPLLEKIEASIVVNLLTPAERNRMEVAFDFDALLRADLKSRYESYRLGISAGLMTPNEARAAEHLPAMEGGDMLFMQGAMAPIEKLAAPDPEPQQIEIPDNTPQLNNLEAGLKSLTDEMRSLKDISLQVKNQRPAPAPAPSFNFSMDTTAITKAAKAIEDVAGSTLKQIREDVQNMPIVIPAPQVTVEAIMPEQKQVSPTVNITNEVRPADVTVVNNHPKQAVQTVERDANDEIVRTVTKYEV
jgi:HK97 family phage portal protein